MIDFNRLKRGTLTRIGKLVGSNMTVVALSHIFADYEASPEGSNKADRIAGLLDGLRDDNNRFLEALSDLTHPNNFEGDVSAHISEEVRKAFAQDGVILKRVDGNYTALPIGDYVDRVIGVPETSQMFSENAELQGFRAMNTRDQSPLMPRKGEPSQRSYSSDKKKVFVVHGRDEQINTAFFTFLRAAGLQPLEWTQIVNLVGSGTPYTLDVIVHGLSTAQAVIVLATPDEAAALEPHLGSGGDREDDLRRSQPRPNVLIELGMALAADRDRTVIVTIGNVELGSDIHGLNVIRFDGSSETRNDVLQRLQSAGCSVDQTGRHWITEGNFTTPLRDATLRSISASGADSPTLGSPQVAPGHFQAERSAAEERLTNTFPVPDMTGRFTLFVSPVMNEANLIPREHLRESMSGIEARRQGYAVPINRMAKVAAFAAQDGAPAGVQGMNKSDSRPYLIDVRCLYQSGFYAVRTLMFEDFDEKGILKSDGDRYLGFKNLVYWCTLATLLARNLMRAVLPSPSREFTAEIEVAGALGRYLIDDTNNDLPYGPMIIDAKNNPCHEHMISRTHRGMLTDFETTFGEFARDFIIEVCELFNATYVTRDVVEAYQYSLVTNTEPLAFPSYKAPNLNITTTS